MAALSLSDTLSDLSSDMSDNSCENAVPVSLEERFQNMTGNTKVWRAPLAGLASVAMIATMGVAASTANAAPAADPSGAVTLNANGGTFVNGGNGDGTLTYWEGNESASYATRNNGRLEELYASQNKVNAPAGKTFTGWYRQDGTSPVSPSDAIAPGTVLYAHYTKTDNGETGNKVTFKNASVNLPSNGQYDAASSFFQDAGNDAVVYVKAGDTLANWEASLIKDNGSSANFFGGWKLNGTFVSDFTTVKGGSTLRPDNSGANTYKLTTGTPKSMIKWSFQLADGQKKYVVSTSGETEVKISKDAKPETVKAYYVDSANGAQVVNNWSQSGSTFTANGTDKAYAVSVNAKFYGQTENDYFETTYPWWQLPFWQWLFGPSTRLDSDEAWYAFFDTVDESQDFLNAVDLSDYEKVDGYNFRGFYYNPTPGADAVNLEGVNAGSVFDGNRVASIWAVFDDDNSNTIAVKFDENYDDAAVTTKNLALKTSDGEDNYLGYDLPTPTRDGYTFEGWYPKADGTGRQLVRNDKVSVLQEYLEYNGGTRSITLYAKWESSSYATLNQLLRLTNEVTGRHGKTLYNKDSFAKFEKARDAVKSKYNLDATVKYTPDNLPQAQADAAAQALLSAKAQLVLTPDARGQFRDVTEATPHYEAIYKLGLAGVINGYADGTFSPATGMTRADFAAYLYRVAGSPSYTVNASDDVFSDVDSSTPHYKEILWASKAGILKGYADGTFGWAALVNRQDAAAFLYRLAGSPDFDEKNAKSNFSDVDSSTPHYKEILWAAANGVVYGYADGTFNGGATILRQDAAALLNRAVVADYLK